MFAVLKESWTELLNITEPCQEAFFNASTSAALYQSLKPSFYGKAQETIAKALMISDNFVIAHAHTVMIF